MMKFPGTNYNDLNLDWILKEIKELREEFEELREQVLPQDDTEETDDTEEVL